MLLEVEDTTKAEVPTQAPAESACVGWCIKERCHSYCHFQWNYDANTYGDILAASFAPFIREKYPNGHRLFHTMIPNTLHSFFQKNNINCGRGVLLKAQT